MKRALKPGMTVCIVNYANHKIRRVRVKSVKIGRKVPYRRFFQVSTFPRDVGEKEETIIANPVIVELETGERFDALSELYRKGRLYLSKLDETRLKIKIDGSVYANKRAARRRLKGFKKTFEALPLLCVDEIGAYCTGVGA